MHGAHILRKYEPAEWGGTETAVLRLLSGLAGHGVRSTVWCPANGRPPGSDPLAAAGHEVRRFRAFVPVAGISAAQREQLVSLGGNLMSFDLLWRLWRTRELDFIHSHALNRLAGIGGWVARRRRIPFVVTIHGGALDLPASAHAQLVKPLEGGWEWGRIFGWALQSRRVLETADAVLTCNPREAELVRARHPRQRVIVQPHSVPTAVYERDHRAAARAAFPAIAGRRVLLTVARIDPAKNHAWLVEQLPALLARFPDVLLVFAGATTHAECWSTLQATITRLGLGENVLCTGGLAPGGDVLVGLLQEARALVLPSTNETFGLVILEAWAAGTAVIASRTSGAVSLVRPGENGWLFDINDAGQFLAAATEALARPELAAALAGAGRELARTEHDAGVLAGRVKELYQTLLAEKRAR
jgi:glycosyltransferase involved in cell wall biosynthesis